MCSRAKINGLFDGFKQNPNLALSASISSISIVKLRDDLNKLTFAMEEDTQVKTDRIVRVIIQVRQCLFCPGDDFCLRILRRILLSSAFFPAAKIVKQSKYAKHIIFDDTQANLLCVALLSSFVATKIFPEYLFACTFFLCGLVLGLPS